VRFKRKWRRRKTKSALHCYALALAFPFPLLYLIEVTIFPAFIPNEIIARGNSTFLSYDIILFDVAQAESSINGLANRKFAVIMARFISGHESIEETKFQIEVTDVYFIYYLPKPSSFKSNVASSQTIAI